MAARKRPAEIASLFVHAGLKAAEPAKPTVDTGTPVIHERRFSVIKSPEALKEEVIVEMVDDDAFVVSLLRHHGTTVAAVRYSRAQLEQLIVRASAALEAG